MYKDPTNPASILIVKTSSLGDIIQAFNVLDDLHNRFPKASIDWAVEASFHSIVAAHPLVRRAISLDIKRRRNLWGALRALRQDRYDLIFDLQANCKSGLITLLARGRVKVGYGLKSVREFPNVLATHVRFNISKAQNIRSYYLQLIDEYFKREGRAPSRSPNLSTTEHTEGTEMGSVVNKEGRRGASPRLTPISEKSCGTSTAKRGVRFHIDLSEQQKITQILAGLPAHYKIMVCPGSKWINKQLPLETMAAFLKKIHNASFFLIWGDEAEKTLCTQLHSHLQHSVLVDKLPVPTWQNLISEMDLLIAVDSSALHLCGTTATPSFSIFGPTSPHIFKPLGIQHIAFQGPCPYNRTFEKQCPVLRSCPTGACIRNITADELFQRFEHRFL